VPKARSVEGMSVYSPRARKESSRGKTRLVGQSRLGVVDHVLFHPKRPHAVGFEIRRAPLFYLVQRKPVFVPLDQVDIGSDQLTLKSSRPLKDRAAEKKHGFEWEKTVIWVGMPVKTRSGESAGQVRDVSFSAASGDVRTLYLTEGIAADVAVGTKTIDGKQVVGFDGASVLIEEVLEETEFAGGMAKHAGKGAAVAKVGAERAAQTAIAAGKAGAKVAAQSELGKRAMRGLRAFTKAAKEAMRADDD